MKKFLVVAVVLAMVCISSVAFALDVTLSGEAAVRSRLFENMVATSTASQLGDPSGTNGLANSHGNRSNDAYTQTRFLVEVNIKGEGVKGKLSLWNDFDNWGQRAKNTGKGTVDNTVGYSTQATTNSTSASTAYIREAWIDFMIPGTPVGVKAGRQLMQIGNGWFFRSNYSGSDAWVVYANLGKVATIAVQDVKISEGTTASTASATVNNSGVVTTIGADDVDLYSLIATVKPADAITAGINVSYLNDRSGIALTAPGAGGGAWLWNLGFNATAKAGAATINAEFDVQSGHSQSNGTGGVDYDGYQGIVQATIPVGIVTINAGGVYSSGTRPTSGNVGTMVTFGDAGQHATLIYEYRTKNAAGLQNGLFQNTMALNAGAMVQVAKSVAVGADVWWLNATEVTNLGGGATKSHDLGWEADAKLNWQITPNLSWNWQAGWLMTGSAYRNSAANGGAMDDIYAVQGVLSLKF